MTDTRPKWEQLLSRAQVPLHQATLALQNILGDDHALAAELEQVRFKVNAEIARLKSKDVSK